jgi:hypothetical protein
MSKYIEAERLKEKLDEHYRKYQSKYMETRTAYTQGLIDALDLAEQVIDSLQEEMPDKETILRICKLHKAWSIMAPWENVEDFVRTNWNLENIV